MLVTSIPKQANNGYLSKMTSFADPPTSQDIQKWFSILNENQKPRKAYKTQIAGPFPQSVRFSRSRVGPKNLQQVPRWYWCYWSEHHALRATALKLGRCYSAILKIWKLISHLDFSYGLSWVAVTCHKEFTCRNALDGLPFASPDPPPHTHTHSVSWKATLCGLWWQVPLPSGFQ